ncbi:MAG TPA: squalene/phytoene synthase family protein [Chthoniobacterales bacterium]|nr:squalene/phytoene synthase family protein [Chthoniobacterales bacterium]
MNAAKITRDSKSNLALAFVALGRERRNDITIFYAFCRVVDDIADSTEASFQQKAADLRAWRKWIRESTPGEPDLAGDVRGLYAKYAITPAMLDEIIDGVEMDVGNVRYQTFEDLRLYCHRVASAVGLVSIEIFGYRNPGCRDYAMELGLALQMTNIIRDVGKDLSSGRIYLPQEDLARFDYPESALRERKHNDAFVRLMEFESDRAEKFFSRAAALLPPEDRRSMVAAEIMASVYHTLLRRMKKDRFRVFDKEYRLSKIQKSGRVAGQLLRLCLNAGR